MAEITVPLSDARLLQLEELAASSGLSVEELLRQCVDQWLGEEEQEFARAAEYVLKKNAELYRRLA
jgi:hypothetical protein